MSRVFHGKGAKREGRAAKTIFRCVGYDEHTSLLLCLPLTGRTHQIRVHLQFLGYPIANDVMYGGRLTPSNTMFTAAPPRARARVEGCRDCERAEDGGLSEAERDNPVAASIWLHALEYACVGCNDADRAGGNGDEREGGDKGGDLNASPFALACLQRWVTHFERNACHTPSSLTPTSRLGDTNQLSNNRNNPNDPNQTLKRETNNHGSAQPPLKLEEGGWVFTAPAPPWGSVDFDSSLEFADDRQCENATKTLRKHDENAAARREGGTHSQQDQSSVEAASSAQASNHAQVKNASGVVSEAQSRRVQWMSLPPPSRTSELVRLWASAYEGHPSIRWAEAEPKLYGGVLREFLLKRAHFGVVFGERGEVASSLALTAYRPLQGAKPAQGDLTQAKHTLARGRAPTGWELLGLWWWAPWALGISSVRRTLWKAEKGARMHAAFTALHGPNTRIDMVSTLPEARGRGLATELLTATCERADQQNWLLYLSCSDPRLTRFYERFGFRVVAEVQVDASMATIAMARQCARERASDATLIAFEMEQPVGGRVWRTTAPAAFVLAGLSLVYAWACTGVRSP